MQSNNVRDDHAIPDQDYLNFINRLREVGKAYENLMDQVREVGKADFLEPDLAGSRQAEVSESQLEYEGEKKRRLNNGYNDANDTISDSDYMQFCNHLRNHANSNIMDLDSNTHKRVSAAATMDGATEDGEIIDHGDEKDSKNTCNDHCIPDSGYLLFLNHLKADGNSYFLELVDDQNGSSMIFRYEEEEEDDKEEEEEEIEEEKGTVSKVKKQRILHDVVNKKMLGSEEIEEEGMGSKLKKQRISHDVVNKKMLDREERTNSGNNHSIPAPKPIPDASLVINNHVSSGCSDVDESYERYLDRLKLVDGDWVFDSKSAAPKHNDTECLTVDPAYQEFLNRLRQEDGFMVLDLKSGGSIRYEEEPSGEFSGPRGSQNVNACSVDHSPMPYEISSLDSHSQFEVCDNDTRDVLESFNYSEKLMEFISRPYDQNEYDELLKGATVWKPLCRQKHLRSVSKIYATNEKGHSYLDYHPDLAKLLKKADREKRLQLLRGLFFWLKNLCHEGAFKPWMPRQAKNSAADDNEGDDDVYVLE